MLYKLHYWLMTSGFSAATILMGVFLKTYTDAKPFEIGALFMIMPFTGIIFRPIICSMADRRRAHRKFLMLCLFVVTLGYSPFVIIPYLGPEVYETHARACWYTFVVLKVMGDIAVGGSASIGDALAINYAARIGTEFSVYRIWGTISWMVFGLIIGQINEVSFMPKYVPGFMILITSTLLDMLVIWLWPKEYFQMVPMDLVAKRRKQEEEASSKETSGGGDRKPESDMFKSLLPKEVVLARMRRKICSVFCCGLKDVPKKGTNQLSIVQFTDSQCSGMTQPTGNEPELKNKSISKRIQMRILWLLIKRDPRLPLYMIFFVVCGFCLSPLSFFFISLSHICHEQGTCQFSQLAGMLQASMASLETIFFMYDKRIKAKLGRVNLCAVFFVLLSSKFLFYGTYWTQVSPYYSLISEMLHGVGFGIGIVLMAEMAHLFANEVEFILPELVAKGIIEDGSSAESERLKLSLSATMQALTSTASDGVGRGFGALVCGVILDTYSFESLWLMIGIVGLIALVICVLIKLFDTIFKPNLGLDVAAARQAKLDKKCQVNC